VRTPIVFLITAAALASCSPKAPAADGGEASVSDLKAFIGTWTHKGNIIAPWLVGPGFLPDPEPEIIEKPLVIGETSSVGPSMLSCETAVYSVTTPGLDGLFEGKVTDPYIASSVLGIDKDKIPTLAESCKSPTGDMELNYHLIDKDKLLLGLNNVVYQFERAKP